MIMYLVVAYVPITLNLLTVPSCKLNFGTRSFRVAAPTILNSLPADIRAFSLYSSFMRHLKTFYFNTAFNELLLLGYLVTARASDSMFLSVDFVHVTNCFYDYDYDWNKSLSIENFMQMQMQRFYIVLIYLLS